uniref:Annexin n=1 Tax=Rodentolepis nana TaxID=102285 RepID=A0A158QI98_RODNA
LIHLFAPNGDKYKTTVAPTAGFSPTADAEYLKKAMKGLGTNEKAIINILGRRTTYERMAIRDAYPSISSKTLEKALKSDLSWKFEDFCLMLIKSPAEIMAEALYEAMKGPGTKERVLNEILGGISKSEINDLKKAYENVSGGKSLEDAIRGDTSGDYREALLLVLAGQSDEPDTHQLKKLNAENVHELINVSLAERDAKEIYDCGEGRLGTKESRFMRPIINRSVFQLNATNEAYIRKYGKPLVEAIKKETSGDFEDFLLFKVRYATDRAALFAELLNFCMKGIGTKDVTLQRTLALRADTDLGSIRDKYAELYGESLEDALRGDTSGDYKLTNHWALLVELKLTLGQPFHFACQVDRYNEFLSVCRQYARPLIHLFGPNGEKYKATISPTPGFSPTADAEHLKAAMRGIGTNEEAIINILGRRTTYERLAIRDAYPSISSKTLDEALRSELSRSFEEFCQLLIQSPAQIMAEALYKAMKGAGTKERVLNEIFGGISKSEIVDLKRAFENVSGGETLEDAISGDTSGDYKEALLLILAAQSDEPPAQQLKNLSPANLHEFVNKGLAEQDAKEIYDSGEGYANRVAADCKTNMPWFIPSDFYGKISWYDKAPEVTQAVSVIWRKQTRMGTAENRFMRPILNRSFIQLNATNEAYMQKYGKPLVEAIKKETSNDFEDLLVFRVRYAIERAALLAELLHFAMAGAGTKDATLQRTLALRADTDLGAIKEKYAELYGESLEDAIKGDTSGDYEALCLKLIGA